jgi:hypothetical protein
MIPPLAGMAFFMGKINRASTMYDGRLADYGRPTLAEARTELSKFPMWEQDRLAAPALVAAMNAHKLGSCRLKGKRVGRVCHCNSPQVRRGTTWDHNGRLAPLFRRIT